MAEQKKAHELHIGFIGVGVMGRPMVSNLLKAGYLCTIYDINPGPVEALVAEGASSANSPAEVAKVSDVFITMVVNDAQFAATLFEPGNAASTLQPGVVVVGMSTMSMKMVQEAAARLEEAGVHYLDAPVSGGETGATKGTLSIMVGGPSEIFERCRPVLSVLGSNFYHVGQNVGDGQAVKMINQLMVCVHNAVAAEALTLGEKVAWTKQCYWRSSVKALAIVGYFLIEGHVWFLSNFRPLRVLSVSS